MVEKSPNWIISFVITTPSLKAVSSSVIVKYSESVLISTVLVILGKVVSGIVDIGFFVLKS